MLVLRLAVLSYAILQVGMVDLRWGGAVLYLPDALLLLQVAPGQGGRTGQLRRRIRYVHEVSFIRVRPK